MSSQGQNHEESYDDDEEEEQLDTNAEIDFKQLFKN